MSLNRVTLRSGSDARHANLTVDGVWVPATRAELILDPNDGVPVLRVDLPIPTVEHDGDTRVELVPEVRDVLLALGWTPPEDH